MSLEIQYRIGIRRQEGFLLLPFLLVATFLFVLVVGLLSRVTLEHQLARQQREEQRIRQELLFMARVVTARVSDQLTSHQVSMYQAPATGEIHLYDTVTGTALGLLGALGEDEASGYGWDDPEGYRYTWALADINSRASISPAAPRAVTLETSSRRDYLLSLPSGSDYVPLASEVATPEPYHALLAVPAPVTTRSFGLLVDPSSGRVKESLREARPQDHPLITEDLLTLLGMEEESAEEPYPLTLPGNEEGFQHHAVPVLTEFVLNMGLAREEGTGNLFLCYYLFADLWNPYTRSLATDALADEFLIKVTGLPRVTLSRRDADVDNPLDAPVEVELPEVVHTFDIYGDFKPGSVQLVASPTAEGGESGNGVHQLLLGTIPLHGTEVDLDFTASDIEVGFYLNTGPEPRLISRTRLNNYPPFRVECVWEEHVRRFVRVRTGNRRESMSRQSLQTPAYAFAIHYRLLDEEGMGDLDYWWSEEDPRKSEFAYDIATGEGDRHYVLRNPREVYRTDFMSDLDFWCYSYSGGRRDRIARVFDLPTHSPATIAQLGHLQVSGHAPFSLGGKGEIILNELFDRFHLSDGEMTESGLLPGVFNINSRDPRSWDVFLSGADILEWEYSHEREETVAQLPTQTSTLLVNHSFTAGHFFAEGGDGGSYRFMSEEDFADFDEYSSLWRQHAAFIQGVRSVERTGEEPSLLALEVVRLLEERGEPFHSSGEFISSGLLQEAIDSATTWNVSASGHPIPTNAPSYIRQQTFWQARSDRLTTRSDSVDVLIRLEPALFDEVNYFHRGLLAQLQRFPGTNDGGESRIVSLQWLD